jgi:methylated-DNA-[protein]-cysteine S-methyltransferase
MNQTSTRTDLTLIASPIGDILLSTDGRAVTGLFMNPPSDRIDPAATRRPADAFAKAAAQQLRDYFEGARRQFELPIVFRGTPFQERAWKGLLTIPYGETISYAELARRIGAAGSARAVGTALGRNPVAIIVPCHRVIGSSGSLVGFGGGLDRKRWLLELERATCPGLFEPVSRTPFVSRSTR